MLELWPIAREVISPPSFQTIKKNKKKTLLKKTRKQNGTKKILSNPTSFQVKLFLSGLVS